MKSYYIYIHCPSLIIMYRYGGYYQYPQYQYGTVVNQAPDVLDIDEKIDESSDLSDIDSILVEKRARSRGQLINVNIWCILLFIHIQLVWLSNLDLHQHSYPTLMLIMKACLIILTSKLKFPYNSIP